jgi:TPR repeat protein
VRGAPPTAPPFPLANGKSENQRTAYQLQQLAALHGMFGLGSAAVDAQTWIAEYAQAVPLMAAPNAAPVPGAISLGTDMDGLVLGSPPSPGAHVVYSPDFPMSTLGGRTWNYNDPAVGVAHYGMLAEFLADARLSTAVDGKDMVDNHVYQGADYFYQTWVRCEQLSGHIPADTTSSVATGARRTASCTPGCCSSCALCASEGTLSGTCSACGGCSAGCSCAQVAASASAPIVRSGPAAQANVKRACDSGRIASCVYLARILDEGDGVKVDSVRASALFKQACDRGSAEACFRLAGHYQRGAGVAKSPSRAAQLFEQACNAGNRYGCISLAAMYEQGLGVPRDPRHATRVYGQMCSSGDRYGCDRSRGPTP